MIVGWKNPVDGRTYGLEEFGPMGEIIPEPVLRAMVTKEQTDTRHSGDNLTITMGTGCPRKALIQRMLPVTPDPTKMWKMQRGTWLHEMVGLQLGENEQWWTEETVEDKCVYEGTLFGLRMSCKLDALRRDYGQMIDWKFRGDYATNYVTHNGRAKPEDAVQANMIRMLIEQNTGKDLSGMQMHVWVMGGECKRTIAPYMTEAEIGEVRPGSTKLGPCKYNVAQIFEMLGAALAEWRTHAAEHSGDLFAVPQDTLRGIVGALPMVGETQYLSKKSVNACVSYCEVQEECYDCSGGI